MTMKCKDCGEKCDDGTPVTVTCIDKSKPVDGKCADGSLTVITQGCTAVPKACGVGCSALVEGKSNCDISHPTNKCTTVWNQAHTRCIDCQCLP